MARAGARRRPRRRRSRSGGRSRAAGSDPLDRRPTAPAADGSDAPDRASSRGRAVRRGAGDRSVGRRRGRSRVASSVSLRRRGDSRGLPARPGRLLPGTRSAPPAGDARSAVPLRAVFGRGRVGRLAARLGPGRLLRDVAPLDHGSRDRLAGVGTSGSPPGRLESWRHNRRLVRLGIQPADRSHRPNVEPRRGQRAGPIPRRSPARIAIRGRGDHERSRFPSSTGPGRSLARARLAGTPVRGGTEPRFAARRRVRLVRLQRITRRPAGTRGGEADRHP